MSDELGVYCLNGCGEVERPEAKKDPLINVASGKEDGTIIDVAICPKCKGPVVRRLKHLRLYGVGV